MSKTTITLERLKMRGFVSMQDIFAKYSHV